MAKTSFFIKKNPINTPPYVDVPDVALSALSSLLINGFLYYLKDEKKYLTMNRPGLLVPSFCDLGTDLPIDGLWWWPSKKILLAVSGGLVFKIDKTGTATQLTGVTLTIGLTNFEECGEGGKAAFMASGGLLVYTDDLVTLKNPQGLGVPTAATHVSYMDDHVIANEKGTSTFKFSDPGVYTADVVKGSDGNSYMCINNNTAVSMAGVTMNFINGNFDPTGLQISSLDGSALATISGVTLVSGSFADGNAAGTLSISVWNDVPFLTGPGTFIYRSLSTGFSMPFVNGTQDPTGKQIQSFDGTAIATVASVIVSSGTFAAGTAAGTIYLTTWNKINFLIGTGTFLYLNVATAWNPSDQNSYVAISGNNLIATSNSTDYNIFGNVRATQGVSQGKWYWEVKIDSDVASDVSVQPNVYIGIASELASEDKSGFFGSDSEGWSYANNSAKYHNGLEQGNGQYFVKGDVIGISYDADHGILIFYKNGVSLGIAYSGISGTIYPAVSLRYEAIVYGEAGQITANFGASPFAYSMPILNSGNTTGTVSSGSTSLIVNSNAGMAVNQYIVIAGLSGDYQIEQINGTTITISPGASGDVTGAAVSFGFKPLGLPPCAEGTAQPTQTGTALYAIAEATTNPVNINSNQPITGNNWATYWQKTVVPPNQNYYSMPFINGSVNPTAGSVIQNAAGTASASVVSVEVSSGTFTAGTAAGTIYLEDYNGENFDIGSGTNTYLVVGRTPVVCFEATSQPVETSWVPGAAYSAGWQGLSFANMEAKGEVLQALDTRFDMIILFGKKSIEYWVNDGSSPFSKYEGLTSETGTIAPDSVIFDGNLHWMIDNDRNLVQLINRAPKVISNPFASLMQQMEVIEDAFAISVKCDGRNFVVITFPTANLTIAYDAETDMWQGQWGLWNINTGDFDQWIPRCSCKCPEWGFDLVGDRRSGKIYKISRQYATDAESILRIVKRNGMVDYGIKYKKRSERLRLTVQRGVGLPEINTQRMTQPVNTTGVTLSNCTNPAGIYPLNYTIESRIKIGTSNATAELMSQEFLGKCYIENVTMFGAAFSNVMLWVTASGGKFKTNRCILAVNDPAYNTQYGIESYTVGSQTGMFSSTDVVLTNTYLFADAAQLIYLDLSKVSLVKCSYDSPVHGWGVYVCENSLAVDDKILQSNHVQGDGYGPDYGVTGLLIKETAGKIYIEGTLWTGAVRTVGTGKQFSSLALAIADANSKAENSVYLIYNDDPGTACTANYDCYILGMVDTNFLSWNDGTPVGINGDGVYTLTDNNGKTIEATVIFNNLPIINTSDSITISGSIIPAREPVFTMRSRVDGQDWTDERTGSLGKIGEVYSIVEFRQNGVFRYRQDEYVFADAVPLVLIDCEEEIQVLSR